MAKRINYPKEFRENLKNAFPKRKELHNLAKKGSEDVGQAIASIFHENSTDAVLNKIKVHFFLDEWFDIYNKKTDSYLLETDYNHCKID